MARRSSPARLVIALGVAAMLAVFLVYTSLAGGTPQLRPSQLKGRSGEVTIVGKVVAPVERSGRTIRFQIRDVEGGSSVRVPVTYSGSVPDMFKVGRDISLKGRLRSGTFVGVAGTLVTKCPSKYSSKKES
ncbi:MAG TPA: cytochrome c maturation protein CcmE [Gaiellaceae bacterium]|nr:cytochrome c maturation protein CcmE [Gaiellaceae bacterium]HET8652588.1 cytochrome c maturation protein CcmE [Gaiellaceae bacterium]